MQRIAILVSLCLAIGVSVPAAAQNRPWQGASVLDDPAWQAHFLASYGVLSGVEPDIDESEREVLREVLELMRTDPQAAAARLAGAVAANTSASLDFVLANLYFQDGQLDEAIRYYESALEKFPDFRRAHKNLGLLRVQQNDCNGALAHLQRAVELGDRDGRNFGLLGFCSLERESYIAAEEAYRSAILQQPDTRDWKLGLARTLLAMEKYQDAVAIFDVLLEENPEDASAWLLQANAYIGLDQLSAAAVDLETVRMLGKAQPSSLALLGDIYMKSGMPDLAEGVYLEVIESDQGAARFRTAYRAADLLVRTRSYDQAQKVVASIDKRYRDLTPEDQLDLLTLKARLARGQGRSAEAAKLLESIVRRDGTRGDALLELAAYYKSQGDLARALLLVERAEKIESSQYPALLEHAQILVAQRDYEKAADLLRRALQIKSEPRVERYLGRVEQAIGPPET